MGTLHKLLLVSVVGLGISTSSFAQHDGSSDGGASGDGSAGGGGGATLNDNVNSLDASYANQITQAQQAILDAQTAANQCATDQQSALNDVNNQLQQAQSDFNQQMAQNALDAAQNAAQNAQQNAQNAASNPSTNPLLSGLGSNLPQQLIPLSQALYGQAAQQRQAAQMQLTMANAAGNQVLSAFNTPTVDPSGNTTAPAYADAVVPLSNTIPGAQGLALGNFDSVTNACQNASFQSKMQALAAQQSLLMNSGTSNNNSNNVLSQIIAQRLAQGSQPQSSDPVQQCVNNTVQAISNVNNNINNARNNLANSQSVAQSALQAGLGSFGNSYGNMNTNPLANALGSALANAIPAALNEAGPAIAEHSAQQQANQAAQTAAQQRATCEQAAQQQANSAKQNLATLQANRQRDLLNAKLQAAAADQMNQTPGAVAVSSLGAGGTINVGNQTLPTASVAGSAASATATPQSTGANPTGLAGNGSNGGDQGKGPAVDWTFGSGNGAPGAGPSGPLEAAAYDVEGGGGGGGGGDFGFGGDQAPPDPNAQPRAPAAVGTEVAQGFGDGGLNVLLNKARTVLAAHAADLARSPDIKKLAVESMRQ